MSYHPALRFLHRLRVGLISRFRRAQARFGPARVTPIFVLTCDRTTALQRSLASYTQALSTPYEVVIHDNASTYKPMIELLAELEASGTTIFRRSTPVTDPADLNDVSLSIKDWYGANRHRRLSGFYIVTDPDIALDPLPDDMLRRSCDIIQFCSYLLDKMPSIKVAGPMLRIDDLPDHYPLKQSVLWIHNERFWHKQQTKLTWNGINTGYQFAPTDTTFGVYRRDFSFRRLSQGVRVYHPFTARHLDWYIDPANMTEDQEYYMSNATRVSNWSGTRFPRS